MKVACQTITFGSQKHKDDIESMMKSINEAGYSGLETGFSRFDPKLAETYKPLLQKYSLSLAAIHIGGDFQDEESVRIQMENVPNLTELAHALECKNIFISGHNPKEGANYELTAKNLNMLGAKLKESGLTLSYHNHDWEIKNGAAGLYTIYDNTDGENLSFVPDIGWVRQGGANPVDVLRKISGRVSNVHFKEFTADGGFTEMGRGIVDFKDVYEFLKSEKDLDNMWIIAEQDQSSIGAEQSVKINYEYIKSLEE